MSSSKEGKQPLLGGGSKESTAAASSSCDSEVPIDQEGLTTAEAQRRLARDGYNELVDEAMNPCLKFLSYFWGPMPIMIWLAAAIESVTAITENAQHFLDVGVLLLLQLVNGTMGWYEERNAGNAIAALKTQLALLANTKRDSAWITIPARELVQGDILHLKLGDVVPADVQLLPNMSNLPIQVDQSALNGESLPKTMYPGDTALQGSIVKRGEIDALVTATGIRTFFGRASTLVNEAENKRRNSGMLGSGGHFQKLVTKLTLGILLVSLLLVSVLVVRLLLQDKQSPLEIVSTGVVLLVASIPIAMQVVCTSTMAVGAHKLASREALVSRLTAIEELAGMNVLCSDKTGTLTLNKLSINEPWMLNAKSEQELIFLGCLAAKHSGDQQDAIDQVLTDHVVGEIGHGRAMLDNFTWKDYVPFDPVSKRTEALVEWHGAPSLSKFDFQKDGVPFRVAKGAPQVVLAMCHDFSSIEEEVTARVNSYASRGYRTIGVAKAMPNLEAKADEGAAGESSKTWQFVGLIPLRDECRPKMREIIEKAFDLGVVVKMITGDQTAIAKETCRELNMGSLIYNADVLNTDGNAMARQELADTIENASGFAEVFPKHKYEIVTVLQGMGYRVGMTGDGVNDAPALKAADIGIAVADATDAARAASDIVLTCEGLGVIIEAIARARMIFERMRNYCVYRIACTLQLLLFFFVSMMFLDPSLFIGPEEPIQVPEGTTFQLPVICLVVITLLNDGCILSIAYDHVTPSKKPAVWKLPEVVMIASAIGFISCGILLTMLMIGLGGLDRNTALYKNFWSHFVDQPLTYLQLQTMMYMGVSVSGFLVIYAARTRSFFWSRAPSMPMGIATVFALAMSTLLSATDLVGMTGDIATEGTSSGLPIGVIGLVWIYCLGCFVLQDAAKVGVIKTLTEQTNSNDAALRESFWALKDSIVEQGNNNSVLMSNLNRSLIQDAAATTTRDSEVERYGATRNKESILSQNSFVSARVAANKAGKPGQFDPANATQSTMAAASMGSMSSMVAMAAR